MFKGAEETSLEFSKYFVAVATAVVFVPMVVKVIFGSDGLGEILGKTPKAVKDLGGRFNINAPAWVPYIVTAGEKTVITHCRFGR